MQIKSFQYFITIADMPTLSAAAQALFVSQPALSQQLRKIEEEIGAPVVLPGGAYHAHHSRRRSFFAIQPPDSANL